MPSSYTPNLGIELPADGELDGVWGDVVNDNMEILDRAINGSVSLSLTGTSSTLTTSDGVLSDGQFKVLVLAGTPSGTHTITISPDDAQKIYFVRNTTAQSVVFTQGSGGNVTIATGDSAVIYSDGAGAGAAVVNITNDFAMSSVAITGGSITGITDLAVADGGTGASTLTGYVKGAGTSPLTASATIPNTDITGLGTISTQAANSVAITGGTIDGTTIGGTTAAAITGTTITATGDVTIPDKIIHAGDTNTSIRFPANDTVTVETNGVERLRVNSAGNVGIGNNNPTAQLEVVTTSGTSTLKIHSATNTTPIADLELQRGTSSTWGGDAFGDYRLRNDVGSLLFQYGEGGVTTERMRIDSAGNVGIGTTSPAEQLHITGNFRVGSAVLATPTGSAPMYAARAWVNFNGTGTVAIRASGNVSSITDNGAGDYTVNFTTAMPDENYAVHLSGGVTGGNYGYFMSVPYQTAPVASSVRFVTSVSGGTRTDLGHVFVTIFR